MVRTVKKPEVRRQEIITAARQLFQEKTYENTSMQDVMDQLGIAKGTIYHYFKSKEELLAAVVEAIVMDGLPAMQHIAAETPGSALDKLRALIAATNLATEHGVILEHLHQPANLGMHTRLLAAAFAEQAPLYAELICQGCAEGIFQTQHPLECAEFILAGVQFLTDVGFYPWTAADLQRRVSAFPALIEAQLKAPAGSFAFLMDVFGYEN
jgi:AcrR family transcriptional regulator